MKKLLTMAAVAAVIATPAFAKTRHQTAANGSPVSHYSGQRPAGVHASSARTETGSQSSDSSGNWVEPTPSP